ncbi:MAG: VOC family protein [Bacteroidetes bacterium]|nr:MAG: VOC family protein [Bacteroidota bacterium]
MNIKNIDHIVLTVNNIDESIEFYTEVLGMKLVTFGQGRKSLHFGNQKINLHQKGNEFEPKAKSPTCGAIDICLIVENSLEDCLFELKQKSIAVIEGIVNNLSSM